MISKWFEKLTEDTPKRNKILSLLSNITTGIVIVFALGAILFSSLNLDLERLAMIMSIILMPFLIILGFFSLVDNTRSVKRRERLIGRKLISYEYNPRNTIPYWISVSFIMFIKIVLFIMFSCIFIYSFLEFIRIIG